MSGMLTLPTKSRKAAGGLLLLLLLTLAYPQTKLYNQQITNKVIIYFLRLSIVFNCNFIFQSYIIMI
jgi:hypothetical protein